MSRPVSSSTPPKKPNPLLSNPLSDKNKSLIQRIILLIGLILLHIITLGLILLYFLAKDKISSCREKADIKDTVPPPRPSPKAPEKDLPPSPPQRPQVKEKEKKPFFKKSQKNLTELVEHYSTTPRTIPENTLRITAEGTPNPDFKFSIPQSVLTFFKTEYPQLFDPNFVPDSSLEKTRRHYIQQQVNYLETKYYLVDIRGDGNCFYRSIGISWLFSLVNRFPKNPLIFQTAIHLVSSQADFINSSQTNQQLTQKLLKILITLQENVSADTLMKILTQSENEVTTTSYLKAISVFYAQQDRSALSKDILLLLITDNVTLFESIIEAVQNEPLLRDCLLNFSHPQRTSTTLVSQTVNCPLINSPSMDIIVAPVLNTLINFLDSQNVASEGQKVIENHILTHSYLKTLWLFFLGKPTIQNITTPTVQLLLFINYYNLTSLTQLSLVGRQAFKAFLDKVNASSLNIETACSEELLSSLNITTRNISFSGQQALFTSTARSFLQEIFTSIDILHCSEHSRQTLGTIHRQICSQLSFSMTYSEKEEVQKLLKNTKFSKKLIKFLQKPLIKKIAQEYQFIHTEGSVLSYLPLELLLLFLNNHNSLVDNILTTTPESAFPLKATLLEYQVLLQSTDLIQYKNELGAFMEEIFRTPISTTQDPIALNEKQALLKRLLRQPELKAIIEKNLSTIDQVTLDNMYSARTSENQAQAETDNVEAMRHFLSFGLVQYVKELSTEAQMQKHMTTYGFSSQFSEDHPLTVMRFDNHYVALIKKHT